MSAGPDDRLLELIADYREARFQREYAKGRCYALENDMRQELGVILRRLGAGRWRRPLILNGWREAPHCWRYYLRRPVRVERVPGQWTSLSLFGFVFFFGESP
jgi:hypothetical protein